jgi:hypothetical protein
MHKGDGGGGGDDDDEDDNNNNNNNFVIFPLVTCLLPLIFLLLNQQRSPPPTGFKFHTAVLSTLYVRVYQSLLAQGNPKSYRIYRGTPTSVQ